MKTLRWWMIGLLTLDSIIKYEATPPGLPNFTGAFVGMACQDMSGAGCPVDFDWFEDVERPYRADRFGT